MGTVSGDAFEKGATQGPVAAGAPVLLSCSLQCRQPAHPCIRADSHLPQPWPPLSVSLVLRFRRATEQPGCVGLRRPLKGPLVSRVSSARVPPPRKARPWPVRRQGAAELRARRPPGLAWRCMGSSSSSGNTCSSARDRLLPFPALMLHLMIAWSLPSERCCLPACAVPPHNRRVSNVRTPSRPTAVAAAASGVQASGAWVQQQVGETPQCLVEGHRWRGKHGCGDCSLPSPPLSALRSLLSC